MRRFQLTTAVFAAVITLASTQFRALALPLCAVSPADPPVAKVKEQREGGVSMDGQTVTLDELRPRLKKHKEADGVVWYYRTSDEPKAREAGEAVIKTIIELKLPVRLMETDEE